MKKDALLSSLVLAGIITVFVLLGNVSENTNQQAQVLRTQLATQKQEIPQEVSSVSAQIGFRANVLIDNDVKLNSNSSGSYVYIYQALYNLLGLERLELTGFFDEATVNATKELQQFIGVSTNGEVTPDLIQKVKNNVVVTQGGISYAFSAEELVKNEATTNNSNTISVVAEKGTTSSSSGGSAVFSRGGGGPFGINPPSGTSWDPIYPGQEPTGYIAIVDPDGVGYTSYPYYSGAPVSPSGDDDNDNFGGYQDNCQGIYCIDDWDEYIDGLLGAADAAEAQAEAAAEAASEEACEEFLIGVEPHIEEINDYMNSFFAAAEDIESDMYYYVAQAQVCVYSFEDELYQCGASELFQDLDDLVSDTMSDWDQLRGLVVELDRMVNQNEVDIDDFECPDQMAELPDFDSFQELLDEIQELADQIMNILDPEEGVCMDHAAVFQEELSDQFWELWDDVDVYQHEVLDDMQDLIGTLTPDMDCPANADLFSTAGQIESDITSSGEVISQIESDFSQNATCADIESLNNLLYNVDDVLNNTASEISELSSAIQNAESCEEDPGPVITDPTPTPTACRLSSGTKSTPTKTGSFLKKLFKPEAYKSEQLSLEKGEGDEEECPEFDKFLPEYFQQFRVQFLNQSTLPSLSQYRVERQAHTQEGGGLPSFLAGGWLDNGLQWYQKTSQTVPGQIFFGNLNKFFKWTAGAVKGVLFPSDNEPDPDLWWTGLRPSFPKLPPIGAMRTNWHGGDDPVCPGTPPDCDNLPVNWGSGDRRPQGSDELGEQEAIAYLFDALEADPNQKMQYFYDKEFNFIRTRPSEHNEIWIENATTGTPELVLLDGNVYVESRGPAIPNDEETALLDAQTVYKAARFSDFITALLESVNFTIQENGINLVEEGELSNVSNLFEYMEEIEPEGVFIYDYKGPFEMYLGAQLSSVTTADTINNIIPENIAFNTPLHIIATLYMNHLENMRDFVLEGVFAELHGRIDIPNGMIQHPAVPYYVRYNGEGRRGVPAWEDNYLYLSLESYKIEVKNTGRTVIQYVLEDSAAEYFSDDYTAYMISLRDEVYAPTNPDNMFDSNEYIEKIPEIPELDAFTQTRFYEIYDFGAWWE